MYEESFRKEFGLFLAYLQEFFGPFFLLGGGLVSRQEKAISPGQNLF
jgi:hypothetical protein